MAIGITPPQQRGAIVPRQGIGITPPGVKGVKKPASAEPDLQAISIALSKVSPKIIKPAPTERDFRAFDRENLEAQRDALPIKVAPIQTTPLSERSFRAFDRENLERQKSILQIIKEPTPKDLFQDKSLSEVFGESFRRGMLRTGSAIETILSVGAKKIGAEQLSGKLQKLSEEDTELSKVGINVIDSRKFREKIKDPKFIAQGIGETLPTLLFGIGVAAPAVAVGAPALVIGGAAFAGTATLEAGFAYQDAKEFGADDKTAEKTAGIVGVVNGILEAIPITKLLTRSAVGKNIKRKIITEITKRVVKQAGLESGTESLQEIVSNSVATVYDKNRDLLSGVPESAFFGGILGGGVQTVADVVPRIPVRGLTIEEVSEPTTPPQPAPPAPIPPQKVSQPIPEAKAPVTAPQRAERGLVEAIPPELQPLAQEARKYKSAEEFVNNFRVFRGNRLEDNFQEILNKADNYGISTSRSEETAQRFANEGVRELYIDPNAKILDTSILDLPKPTGSFSQEKYALDYARKNGYDVIDWSKDKRSLGQGGYPKGEEEVTIINKNVLAEKPFQAKSQLTDFYNQAVRGVERKLTPQQKGMATEAIKQAKIQGAEVTKDGNIVLFHGTDVVRAPTEGSSLRAGTYFTTDELTARQFAMQGEGKNPIIMRIEVPPEKVFAGKSGAYWTLNEPIPLKTDFYNQAVKGVEKPSLTKDVVHDISKVYEGQSNFYDKVQDAKRADYRPTPKTRKTLLASPLKLKFRRQGYIKFPNEEIQSPADIAFAFRSLAQETVESFYLVAMKGNRPVGVELQSIGIINAAMVDPWEITPLLRKLDADGVFLIHNHPSGSIEPSAEDIQLTTRIKQQLNNLGIDLRGHVIINTTEFGLIDSDSNVSTLPTLTTSEEIARVPRFKKYQEWLEEPRKEPEISTSQDIVNLIQGINKNWNKNTAIIFVNNRNVPHFIKVLPNTIDTQSLTNLITTHSQAARAKQIFLVNPGKDLNVKILQTNLRLRYNINLMDSVSITGENTFTSKLEEGELTNIVAEKPKKPFAPSKVSPEKLTQLKEQKKQMLDEFMGTEKGQEVQAQAQENQSLKEKIKKDVLSGIKNNRYFRKQQSLKDTMGVGWLMRRGDRTIVAEPDYARELQAEGYDRVIEIDSLAQEAGFERGEDYLQEQVDISNLDTNIKSMAETELAADNVEFARVLEQLGDIKSEIRGETVTLERFLTELGKRSRTSQRRRKLSAIRDFFGLTDRELKQINRKDPAMMTETEWQAFLNDIQARAAQFADTLQKRNEIMSLIKERDLQRTENVRQAMQLPTLDKMTDEQLDKFLDILSQYQAGDVFLTTRTLETLRTTDLKEARTIREIREDLAKRANVPLEELEKIKVSVWEKFLPDAQLMKRNGFYQLLVKMTHESLLGAEMHLLELERETTRLANAARKSRKRTFGDYLAPEDTEVIKYLETEDGQRDANGLTAEELEYAQFLDSQYAEALFYLQTMHFLNNGIDGYYTHIRRGFLETVKQDGILAAFKEIFSQQQLDAITAEIIGSETDIILAKHKFFQFAMKRHGGIKPTQNAARAFMAYQSAFQKKRALDSVVPVLDAYVYSLAPKETTQQGLEMDRTLKKFFNEWMNNKKGRRFSFGGIIKQNGKFDIALQMGRTITSLIDLGLNIPVAVTPFIGETVLNIQQMTVKEIAVAQKRKFTKQGKQIIKEYEALVGRSVWQSINEASKTFGSKVMEGIFAPFAASTRRANIDFLLGKMTKEEFQSGKLSKERLTELKLEMGKYRHIIGTDSIVGSTSLGGAMTQYKTWAIPTLLTTQQNITSLIQDISGGKIKGRTIFKDKRSRETMRFIVLSLITYLAISALFDDNENDSLYGQVLAKVKRESLTLLGAIDPTLFTSEPRILSFLGDLGKNTKALILLERYKTKEGFKGWEGLKRQFTPRFIKQFQKDKKKSKQTPVRIKLNAPVGQNLQLPSGRIKLNAPIGGKVNLPSGRIKLTQPL